MAKIVIETVEMVKKRYYIEAVNKEHAVVEFVSSKMDPYEYTTVSEPIIDVKDVDNWRDAGAMIGLEGADGPKTHKDSVYYVVSPNGVERRVSSLIMLE
jgi:hypothetical protein